MINLCILRVNYDFFFRLFGHGIGIHLLQSEDPENKPRKSVINPKDNHISFQVISNYQLKLWWSSPFYAWIVVKIWVFQLDEDDQLCLYINSTILSTNRWQLILSSWHHFFNHYNTMKRESGQIIEESRLVSFLILKKIIYSILRQYLHAKCCITLCFLPNRVAPTTGLIPDPPPGGSHPDFFMGRRNP